MKKGLGHYLNIELMRMIFLALLALLTLYSFFDFIGQLNDLGKGDYTVIDALLYVALQVPSHTYELMPIAVLIGTIFALSLLNSQAEMTVMRTAGVSLQRILLWLLATGLWCALMTLLMGEYIVPYSQQEAEQSKLRATQSMVVGQFRSGVWVKDKQSFINIKEMLPDLTLRHIRIYTFDKTLQLTEIRDAQTGLFQGGQAWQLEQGTQTVFLPHHAGVQVRTASSYTWKTNISPAMLAVLLISPDKMSITALYGYIGHLKANKQKTSQYEIALWNKFFYPFICVSMIIIALPFSLGQRRNTHIGPRLFAGVMIGLGFYFFSKVIAHLGQLREWHPLFVVLLPLLIFLGTSVYLLWRQEKR